MSIFSRTTSLFLAFAVVLSTFGQMRNSSQADEFYHHSEDNEAPAYSGISIQVLWGVINLDSRSSNLLNSYSFPDSEEDKKNSSKAALALQSTLEKFPANYLLFSGAIDRSPAVREFLYPFHFYF